MTDHAATKSTRRADASKSAAQIDMAQVAASQTRARLLAQIEECRRSVAELRKLYPHAMRWAVARLP